MSSKSGSVLVYGGAAPGLVAVVKAVFPTLGPVADPATGLSAEERASVRAYVTTGTVAPALMEALPNLGLIACIGTGYDGIDLTVTRARGIAVTHNPGSNASSVAEFAVALLLASVRRIVSGDIHVRDGTWEAQFPRSRAPYARGLIGRRIGILGLGAIGARIATRLAGFEAEIGYHNRRPAADAPYPYFPTALALAQWADVLVLALRAGPDNRHLVDRAMLEALGRDGHLVNIARGSVVDEAVLTEALRDGTIAGAALDVFEDEPRVSDALRALPNVVLTPHEGGVTVEATDRGRQVLVANIAAFFAGEPLPTPIPG